MPYEFTSTDRRRVADDRDQIALTTCLYPQDAEAAVLVMEGDPLDEAGEVLAVLNGLWRLLHLLPLGSAVEANCVHCEIGMEGTADGD